ncbi:DUF1214 domain-containing protein [Mycobacterium crocinum]|uniref:DUF1214 domain-containing protein n=1 Tax=Mycolicibacterium crocinum TaxID=388459 RepID=A0ABY3TTZ4_9MYCO|nr:DUF1214 domain-containing protein [Mycolicibacterium crocinum]MCV7214538.1 DUF1214 domain-containing protein [Mycolicibacterium crocinum]ULN42789.1 DUF1214 domain-containing protein [Mycolicibacterium crocinum]
MDAAVGWTRMVDGLREAGEKLDELTNDLDPRERADGYRALLRAVNNLTGRLEGDPDTPELMPFNGWRDKFFMDNPDYRYWITDIRDGRRYRVTGNVGDSTYQSITIYAGTSVANAIAVARIDTDTLAIDGDGTFEATVDAPQGATSLWVRYIHDVVEPERPGWCRIETLGPPAAPPTLDPADLKRRLSGLGAFVSQIPAVFGMSVAEDMKSPDTVRRWAAMTGGAAFTEPGIDYLRGAWELADGEALVIEGVVPQCRHWNIVLYSRFLNSLDYRRRVVCRTGATSTLSDGHFRFVLAARNPEIAGYDWLDTEGRTFGLFVMRFLQPTREPELPSVRRIPLAEL